MKHYMAETEHEVQATLFDWIRLNITKYPDLAVCHAIPNGGHRNKATAARLKREGVLPGVCDIHLPVPRGIYHGLWIELKVGDNQPTKAQCWFMAEMKKHGYFACVARGFEDARQIIELYLKLEARK